MESPIGELPEGWKVALLKDLVLKVGSGATPTGGSAAYAWTRTKFALVRSQNVYDRYFNEEGLAFISDEQASRLSGVHLQENDLLLNITGDGITFGRSCMIPGDVLPACVNQHVSIIRVNPAKLDAGYLLSFLSLPQTKVYVESFNAGGSRRALTKANIEKFVVPYPDLTEQRYIASILGALDDKIELNRRMNATLEAMAQAVFKEWFVARNAPGGAKEEWEVKTFVELLETNVGGDWGQEVADDEHTERVAIIRGADFPDVQNQSRGKVPIRFTKPSKLKTRKLQPGDLVLEISGGTKDRPTGRCVQVTENMLGWFDEPVVAASFCRLLRPKAGLSNYLALHMDYIYRQGKTWSYQNVSTGLSNFQTKEFLQRELLPLPPPEILDAFNAIIDPITAKRTTSESMTLAALRDTLLPKLMRGEVRVSPYSVNSRIPLVQK